MPATELHSRLSHHHRHPDPPPGPDDAFQLRAALLLRSLLSSPHPPLSSPWLRQLLHASLLLLADLHALLDALPRPLPAALRRALSESLDRALRALDLLSAARDAIALLRRSADLADLAASALPPGPRPLSDPHLRRARRALADLTPAPAAAAASRRNRSFGGTSAARTPRCGHRSLSWSAPRPWSAARQLQAMAAGLAPPPPPRSPEGSSSSVAAAAAAVYTADFVMLLALRALAAAVPCGDAPVHAAPPPPPRVFPWAAPAQEAAARAEEAARGRGCAGAALLGEARGMERAARELGEAAEGGDRGEDWEAEVRARAAALAAAAGELMDGLEVLDGKIREVFRAVAGARARRLDDGLLSGESPC